MLLTNNDAYRILKFLSLPYSQLSFIKEQITKISTEEGEEFEAYILKLLADLESLETTITEEKSNPNAGLIKADVLEWEGGGSRSKGMTQEYNKLRGQLANFLNIDLREKLVHNSGSLTMEVLL